MRTDKIRTIEDIDKALLNIERKLDRTEFAIRKDVDNLLDFTTLAGTILSYVKNLFRKK